MAELSGVAGTLDGVGVPAAVALLPKTSATVTRSSFHVLGAADFALAAWLARRYLVRSVWPRHMKVCDLRKNQVDGDGNDVRRGEVWPRSREMCLSVLKSSEKQLQTDGVLQALYTFTTEQEISVLIFEELHSSLNILTWM